MKKVFKVLGAVVIAALLTVGGYIAGSQNGMESISSALPHVNITHNAPEGSPDSSGAPAPDGDKLPSPDIANNEQTEPEKTGRTVIKTNESAAKEGWSLVKSYTGSLTGKDSQATVRIYTSAETIDGEIIWDDGQQWVVEISDTDGGYYVLMDQFITNGSVYFDVTEADGKTAVNVFTKSCTGMDIKQYTYGKNGFIETTLYSPGTANMLYSSLPDYE